MQENHFVNFFEVLEVKQKTAVRILDASKSKRKAVRTGGASWFNITKQYGHTKINEQVKKYLYNWII